MYPLREYFFVIGKSVSVDRSRLSMKIKILQSIASKQAFQPSIKNICLLQENHTLCVA